MCFELSEGILQIDQLGKQSEDWKKKAIGRWKEGKPSPKRCQTHSSLLKSRPDLLGTEVGGWQRPLTPTPSQECPLLPPLSTLFLDAGSFRFTHRTLPSAVNL